MFRRQYLSLTAFSAGALALEITLTRLLATLYYPPLIFAVLSLAVLGIGVGAALATYTPTLRPQIPLWMTLTGASALLLTPVILVLSTTELLPLLIASLGVPYIFVGLALTGFFSTYAEESRLLYAYDLVGAGIGALLVIPLLNLFGAINALLVIGTWLVASALVYSAPRIAFAITGVGAILVVSNLTANWLTINMDDLAADKPIQAALDSGGHILETRWDAFARTDLVVVPTQPHRLYVDGAAASIIPPAQNNDYLMEDIGLFAFVTAQPQTVFTIGSGGGLDVWFAERVGAESITAVEVNPQSVALVRDYDEYSGGIYDRPNVRVLVDEGRSVLIREDTAYDLIFLSQVVTLSAEMSGYALTENVVFTVEAFADYWNHLTDEGYLALKLYDEPTLSRSLSIIIELLGDEGMTDREALHHTIALLDPSTEPPTPLLIARRVPFTQQEAAVIGRAAQSVGFVSLYLPQVQADSPLDAIEAGTRTYDEVIATADLDLSAPTDDQPFFYQFERGLPADLQPLLLSLGAITLLGIVALAIVYRGGNSVFWSAVLYFTMLGMGFMLLEITLIQKTRLFIGHPTIAITTVLAGVLVSGGLGSAWYHRREVDHLEWQPLALVAITAIIWLLIWQIASPALIGLPLIGRVAFVLLTIAPVGFVMGIPFAAGLERVGHIDADYLPLAWSINGVMTVAGSVLAITVAILFGYTMALVLGAITYGIGTLATRRL